MCSTMAGPYIAAEIGAMSPRWGTLGLLARAGSRWTGANTLLSRPLGAKVVACSHNGDFAEVRVRSVL